MDFRKYLLPACCLLLLAACNNMVGAFRGPEPFGGKNYLVAPPKLRLPTPAKVVVLLLKDERPQKEHELDWVRQANPMGDTTGQPREVRKEFDRAIKSGLAAHGRITLVAPETFAETRDADLVISGRIIRCEAEKKIGWSRWNHTVGPVTSRPMAMSANQKSGMAMPMYESPVNR